MGSTHHEAAGGTPVVRRRLVPWQLQRPLPVATRVDRLCFVVGILVAIWLIVVVAISGLHSWYTPIGLVLIWAITAYLTLPRLNKLLSDIYTPDYFIGRTRTADGVLGDPVNVGVDGSAAQLDEAMLAAGWVRADPITIGTAWKIVRSTLLRRSYPNAPVSPLYLFGRRYDVAYEQQVDGSPKQRHHVRFWHCPPGWRLPGGAQCDWLAAASFDDNVQLSLFTLQVTHRIDQDTDLERDHVVQSLTSAVPQARVKVLHHMTSSYHARNGGGDRFVTDGNLPIVELTSEPVPVDDEVAEVPAPGLSRAPIAVVLGALAVVLGSVVELAQFAALPAQAARDARLAGLGMSPVLALVISILLVAGQVVLAGAVLRGGLQWARLVLIGLLTASVVVVGAELLTGLDGWNNDWVLIGLALKSLAIIALSSPSVSVWCRPHDAVEGEDVEEEDDPDGGDPAQPAGARTAAAVAGRSAAAVAQRARGTLQRLSDRRVERTGTATPPDRSARSRHDELPDR